MHILHIPRQLADFSSLMEQVALKGSWPLCSCLVDSLLANPNIHPPSICASQRCPDVAEWLGDWAEYDVSVLNVERSKVNKQAMLVWHVERDL